MNTKKLDWFTGKGINLQAVFDLDTLPKEVIHSLEQVHCLDNYKRLVLLGHAGNQLWEQVKHLVGSFSDPIDSYTKQCINTFFNRDGTSNSVHILYPGDSASPVPLQQLGALAGWHFDSPLRIGVNDHWGSWFAYRALILTNIDFDITPPATYRSACENCSEKLCIDACPANAIADAQLSLPRCINYRQQQRSQCAHRCLARLACPVAQEHSYSTEQVEYHYGLSLDTIKS